MTDALETGTLAVASWSIYRFNPEHTDTTMLFTVDHHVEIFTGILHGDGRREVEQLASCSGPFLIGPEICPARDSTSPSGFVGVNALAWGCP